MYCVLGILGIIWYIFWLILIFDSPANHPRISKAERDYIESGIPDADKKVPQYLLFSLIFITDIRFPFLGFRYSLHQQSGL